MREKEERERGSSEEECLKNVYTFNVSSWLINSRIKHLTPLNFRHVRLRTIFFCFPFLHFSRIDSRITLNFSWAQLNRVSFPVATRCCVTWHSTNETKVEKKNNEQNLSFVTLNARRSPATSSLTLPTIEFRGKCLLRTPLRIWACACECGEYIWCCKLQRI